ncbi:ABC transporter substrate-binding protein [Anaerotalea alkaliphila]|uniref:Carbohydrate ABC transporter substrate-binding protein n=1 Tax=Anaerotalea alkaliphila TaxID=2662126 RepID=A0A7X5HTP1_9FIRM|nr:ABC transporter substrate-binding protein [Anaerotalea alkaliphila]NDL66472.1 carbohydrate ABC transporter substrate-binding protein [Anaerotalea alkaliphila]
MLGKNGKVVALFLVLGLYMSALAGCGKGTAQKEYDFYIFNGKSENAEAFEKLVEVYQAETGKKVKLFSLGTSDVLETLRTEMNSKEKPTIFSIGAGAAREWQEGGFVLDLAEEGIPELKVLADSIPEGMRLQTEAGENLGIPYNVEGYGLIVDKRMLGELFGLEQADGIVADFKAAGYGEFRAFVEAVDGYIKNETAGTVLLNGNTYTLADQMTERTAALNGVFAVAGAERWTYGDHFSNYALNAVFGSLAAARSATEEQVEQMRSPLRKSIEAYGFKTDHIAGPEGSLERGPELINSTKTGYDQVVQTFAEGKALFIKQGNWIYPNVRKLDETVAENSTILPMKLPFADEDIQVEGLTAEKFNRSIPEFVAQYYSINRKVEETEQVAAQEFLVWLNTTETGQRFIVEEFAFVPFNASADTRLENPLSTDLIVYMREGNVLSNPFNGAPTSWGPESYGKFMMENLLVKEVWTQEDVDAMVETCITQWKELSSY